MTDSCDGENTTGAHWSRRQTIWWERRTQGVTQEVRHYILKTLSFSISRSRVHVVWYEIGRVVNCGGCSCGGCDDGGDEVQVLVIRTQVIRIVVIDGGESLAVPWHRGGHWRYLPIRNHDNRSSSDWIRLCPGLSKNSENGNSCPKPQKAARHVWSSGKSGQHWDWDY